MTTEKEIIHSKIVTCWTFAEETARICGVTSNEVICLFFKKYWDHIE